MQWYYSKNGAQFGPIDQVELISKISSGEIYHSDLVWRDGMADWLPVSKVPELVLPSKPAQSLTPYPQAPGNDEMDSPYRPPVSSRSFYTGPVIPNYLWQSIVVTIFCCWPFGIPAIVYAAKVDGLQARGDFLGAMSASQSAKNWCLAALIGWVISFVVGVIFVAAGGAFSSQ
jgi:hypothetical protein